MDYNEWFEKHSQWGNMDVWKWTSITQIQRGSLLSHWGNVDVVKEIRFIHIPNPDNNKVKIGWEITVWDSVLDQERTHFYAKKSGNGNDMMVKTPSPEDNAFINAILTKMDMPGDYFFRIILMLQDENSLAQPGDPKPGFSERFRAMVAALTEDQRKQLDDIASIADNLPDATVEDACEEIIERIEIWNKRLAKRLDYEFANQAEAADDQGI